MNRTRLLFVSATGVTGATPMIYKDLLRSTLIFDGATGATHICGLD